MTHTPTPRFLVLDEGIINTEDISTALPARRDQREPSPEYPAEGLRLTFMSKSTSIYLHRQTIAGFASLLNGAVF